MIPQSLGCNPLSW